MPSRASRKAKRRRTSPFSFLPSAILRRIFAYEDVLSHGNFVIPKSLLPHTLAALCQDVVLQLPPHIAQFCTALVRQPHLAAEVQALSLLASCSCTNEERVWEEGIRGEYLAKVKGMAEVEEENTEEEEVHVTLAVLQDLLLPLDLKYLGIAGTFLFVGLFTAEYLASGPLPFLRTLYLNLHFGGLWDDPESFLLLANLRTSFPCLSRLSFHGSAPILFLNKLNVGPGHISPRSWPLRQLNFDHCIALGPEVHTLLAACTSTLRRVTLQGLHAARDLLDGLIHLPPSVQELIVAIDKPCSTIEERDDLLSWPYNPKLEVSLFLPKLTFLELKGDCVSPSTFSSLATSHLPSMRVLLLGVHADLHLPGLVSLVRTPRDTGVPWGLGLYIDTCGCKSPLPAPVSRRHKDYCPQWPPHFGMKEAKVLMQVCREENVFMSGSVRCAMWNCRDSHACTKEYFSPTW
ncbi:hypothetical protein JCM8547_006516 [Rhodosporidiobolus lusitaniae]